MENNFNQTEFERTYQKSPELSQESSGLFNRTVLSTNNCQPTTIL